MFKLVVKPDPKFGDITYVVDENGMALLRLRKKIYHNGTQLRIFPTPLTIKEASDHYIDNDRYVRIATKDSEKEKCLKTAERTARIIKTEGPYGGIRYKNSITGRFVPKPTKKSR
jgi:hypothetical protein